MLDQVIPGAQFMGRWSNQDAVGNGYLSLGLSGGNPDHLFWSYSTVRITTQGTCSGTFIGPNVLLTAAHCGHRGFASKYEEDEDRIRYLEAPGTFRALLYFEGSDTLQTGVRSNCQTILQNLGHGDAHLVYCEDVPWLNGTIPPGELLGMADFDLDPIAAGQNLWTSWWNPWCPGWDQQPNYDRGECPGTDQMIFSPGRATKIVPGAFDTADAMTTDQLLAQGSSGAGIWRQTAGSAHRLVSGGIGVGPNFIGEHAGPGSIAPTLRSLLEVADPSLNGSGINTALLGSLDLAGASTPWTITDYEGLMDSDGNGFFDVQERLDDIRGVRSGDSVWLGFGSPRLNRMWSTLPAANVVFFDKHRLARIDYENAGNEVIMEMPKVTLSPGQTYRVSLQTFTDSCDEPECLVIELWETGGTTPISTLPIPTPATSAWTMFAGELQTGAGITQHSVKIRVNGGEYHGSIASLPLIRQGSANRFDTHSDRLNWRNDTTGERAWILPYGNSDLRGEIDWAGLVNDQTSEANDWSLRNRQLAIDPAQPYRVCFKVRSFPEGSGSGVGLVVLGSGAPGAGPGGDPEEEEYYVDETFTFYDTWTRVCSETEFQAEAGDNLLKFGHKAGQPEYLVDDVQIVQL